VWSFGLLALTVSVALEDSRCVVRAPSRMRVAHDHTQPMGISVLAVELDVESFPESNPEIALELGVIVRNERWVLIDTGFEDW
jgi:hypothetical protein